MVSKRSQVMHARSITGILPVRAHRLESLRHPKSLYFAGEICPNANLAEKTENV